MRISTIFFIAAIFLTGFTASNASAAAITINASGSSSYQLVGSGFSRVAGLDVTIRYDPSILESPRITQGALANGTLFVANPGNLGEVKIAFVYLQGVSGTGSIAEITFNRKGSSGVGITGITAKLLDPGSQPLPVTAALGNLSWSTDSGTASPLTTGLGGTTTVIPGTQPSGTSGTGGTALLGTVTLPGEGETGREKQAGVPAEPAAPSPVPAGETVRHEPAPEYTPPAKQEKKEKRPLPTPPANVLELFRTYRGEPTLNSLKKLFVTRGGDWIVQNPPVAPSDGKSLITIQLATDLFNEKAPNFSLKGVEMKQVVSLDSGWAIAVIPARDSLDSSISILIDGSVVEVQVVTVPALPKSWDKVKLTEAEVNRFLADRAQGKSPNGDLNNDGRRDYRDDYIMVGNFLLKEASAEPKEGGKAE